MGLGVLMSCQAPPVPLSLSRLACSGLASHLIAPSTFAVGIMPGSTRSYISVFVLFYLISSYFFLFYSTGGARAEEGIAAAEGCEGGRDAGG